MFVTGKRKIESQGTSRRILGGDKEKTKGGGGAKGVDHERASKGEEGRKFWGGKK